MLGTSPYHKSSMDGEAGFGLSRVRLDGAEPRGASPGQGAAGYASAVP